MAVELFRDNKSLGNIIIRFGIKNLSNPIIICWGSDRLNIQEKDILVTSHKTNYEVVSLEKSDITSFSVRQLF